MRRPPATRNRLPAGMSMTRAITARPTTHTAASSLAYDDRKAQAGSRLILRPSSPGAPAPPYRPAGAGSETKR